MERAERLEALARLKDTALAQVARDEIVALRREYEANLGKVLMKAPPGTTFPQSEVDFKRGFYEGLLWGWTTFINDAAPKLDKLERAMSAAKE